MDSQNKTVSPSDKDEKFSQFINAYALSWSANHFIGIMNPEQRATFFVAIAKTYPNEWHNASAQLISENLKAQPNER